LPVLQGGFLATGCQADQTMLAAIPPALLPMISLRLGQKSGWMALMLHAVRFG